MSTAAQRTDGSGSNGGAGGMMTASSSSRSLNALRKGSQEYAHNQDRSSLPATMASDSHYFHPTHDQRQHYPQQPMQQQHRAASQRQPSVESINFSSLSMTDSRERRPSQPSGAHPVEAILRPDSRNQQNGSPYQRGPTPSRGMSTYSNQSGGGGSVDGQRLSYETPLPSQAENPYEGIEYSQESGSYAQHDPNQQYFPPQGHPDFDSSAYASTSSHAYPQQAYYPDDAAYAMHQQYDPNLSQHQGGQPPHQTPYYDQNSGAYYDPNTGQYFSYNAQTQQYDFAGPSQQQQQPQQVQGYHQDQPSLGASQMGYYPDQYGQQPGYGQPPGGQYQEYPGQSFDLPRAVSAASSYSGGSGGVGAHPNLNRQRTTASAKSGASASDKDRSQPITKQAVDEYRNRIKSDPDPETQFNFARFLIEAARRLAVATQQGSVDDAKSVKKYRDALLQEALKLIKRLATQASLGKPAYADAQFFLANCLGHGALGLQLDHVKAYNLYIQASKQNHPAATYRTAVCNEVGAGTRRDPARAVLFYRKASALGDTAGMYKLGMILLNGSLGQQRNPREAVIWLKKAAAQADEENPHALHELGLLYERQPEFMQNGQPVPMPVVRDEAQAREFFTQAAQFGHPPSQYKLGSCYEYGSLTCPVDPRRSIAWYTRAAEKGHAESELALSGWYLTGSEGVLKQSDSEAYLWARRAANKGLSKAEYAVGYYSEIGIGVKSDQDEAKMWYLRAAASGNRRAMQRLSELKKLGNKKAGAGARPTRQQAKDECVIM